MKKENPPSKPSITDQPPRRVSTTFILSPTNHSNPKPPLSGNPCSSSSFLRKSKRRSMRDKKAKNNNKDEKGQDTRPIPKLPVHSPETIASLTSQIERLESLNISSKLYEAEVQSRLHDEKTQHEEDLADAASKVDEARNTMFKVQDSNFKLIKELNSEKKRNQTLTDQITYQHDMYLNILAKQKVKHVYEMEMREFNERRRDNQTIVEQLELTMIENETLAEEVTSLRASILQLNEVIEQLEYDNLELQFQLKKASESGGAGTYRTSLLDLAAPPTLGPQKISSLALDTTERVTKRHKRETFRKKFEQEQNKVEVKSFIKSWFSDAEFEVKDQQKIAKEEEVAIENAVKEAVRKSSEEHEAKRRKEQAAKMKEEMEKKDFLKAAKSLKSGPGKMVVALTKCEHEIDYLSAKIEMYEQRDEENKKLLSSAENTIMNMVKNVEAEAVSLVEISIPPPDPNQPYRPYSSASQRSRSSSAGMNMTQTAQEYDGLVLELSERNLELERQKRTLLDLLNEYEKDTPFPPNIESLDFARLSLFSPKKVNFRSELTKELGIAGEVTDVDVLYEIKFLVDERKRMLLEMEQVKAAHMAHAHTINTALEHINDDNDVLEMIKAKEIQAKNERARNHSVGMSAAQLAAANPPAPRPPSPTAALDDLEDIRDLQEEKVKNRKHTVGHSEAEHAVEEIKRIERLGEEEKVKKAARYKRSHTVHHSSAKRAMDSFERNPEEDSESYGSDFDDDQDNDEDEEDVDFFSGEKVTPKALPVNSVGNPSATPEDSAAHTYKQFPEETHYPDAKLIINKSKMYPDPLGNNYKFVMTCYCLNFLSKSGYTMFRIKSYDAEVGREMCMDVSEDELRLSMKHDQISFTYDEMDKRFHECILDRLRLVPGHDTNNDGFLNADDVQRDDLTFALVAEGRWKPIKVMVEVGEKGRQKRIQKRVKEIERKKEMALALAEHDQLMKSQSDGREEESPRDVYERIGRNSVGNADDMFGKNGTPKMVKQGVSFERDNDLIIDKSGHADFVSVKRRDESYQREGDSYRFESGELEKQESLVERHKREMEEEQRVLKQLAGDHELDDTDLRLLHKVAGRDSIAMKLEVDSKCIA